MNKIKLIYLLPVLLVLTYCTPKEKYKVEQFTDTNGYKYETVTNDQLKTRIYTLANNLTVYLSVNKDAPRIQTFIPVRAGSSYDPKETTGLAHYLEHMMFKGSDEIATSNWEKEKVELEKISNLYEQHLATNDTEEKKVIYAKIDSISLVAAKYAIPSEYDKMMGTIGAKWTNAWTSNEQTVYMNDIPSNELEKWLKLESERFSQLVLRLFHTELETVYEEFNMSQDNDYRKAHYTLMNGLFPTHPYGTQTTLGKAEHIKNPSMINIHNYWNTYYVPDNMAMCLSGDLDFEETIKLIDKYWGKFEHSDVPEFVSPVEQPITEVVTKEVSGPDAAFLRLGYRFDGIKSEDRKYVTLIDMILANQTAGLIDLNLVQKQKVLEAGAYTYFLKHYGMHILYGNSREGQKLEDVKDLLLKQIEKVKKGEFDEWLIQAAINDIRLSQIRRSEGNWRAYSFVNAFTNFIDWKDYISFTDKLETITKEQLVEFANKHYKDNYVIVYKRTGEDTSAVKIDKPQITAIPLNRDEKSEFFNEFEKIGLSRLEPVFIDFEEAISQSEFAKDVQFNYIKNPSNELFYLYYIIDIGKSHNKKLALAVEYLPYLGTDKYSPAELKKEFYKLGIRMKIHTGDERSYVYISGLDKSFEKGIELLEHVLANVKHEQKSYDDLVDGILKKRADAKLDKWMILWDALYDYGKYGEKSPFTNILSEEELKNINPEELTNLLKEIYSYEHSILYYGQSNEEKVKPVLTQYHIIPSELKDIPEPVKYKELEFKDNKVYFIDYDMVQAKIIMMSKDVMFNKDLIPEARLFAEYFGSGLSSIVFQEIRESRALAYSSFANFSIPYKPDESHFTWAYLSTQADKLKIATDAMSDLMNDMPKVQIQFDGSKESLMKKIETERIIKDKIFWTYLRNKKRGIDYDIRKDTYEKMETITIDELSVFFNEHIKGKNYTYLIIGKKENIDIKTLKELGTVKELTLEEVFNY
ncbi:MAG: insulinase family protein [Bacteroidales bacterium]|nr:insulinase family protein [Bacteroidales bacterium]